MNFNGLIIGIATFLIIGAFHPLVIKAEYHKLYTSFMERSKTPEPFTVTNKLKIIVIRN